jgi:hypothetical protein
VFQGMRSKGSAPVLRLLGQRSGAGTWRQSAQACSQKHRVPGTYIRNHPRHTHARRATLWPSEFLVAWCSMHVPNQRDNRSIRGRVVYKAMMPRGRVRIARVRRSENSNPLL